MMITSRIYRNGALTGEYVDLDKIATYSAQPNTYIWVDLVNPTELQLRKIGAQLDLHELALEDAFKGKQRPKLEHYKSHLFINCYDLCAAANAREISATELSIFVTRNVLITLRDDDEFSIVNLTNRWDARPELQPAGISFLLWGILDQVVDNYFSILDSFDEQLESLEGLIFQDSKDNLQIQRGSYDLRKKIVATRRLILPMREVINPLFRHDNLAFSDSMQEYFQDVYDHVIRATDWIDSLRDLVTTLVETNLTMQGNRMNLIMKKVTSWAAIIAVPTAITGFYGQNVPYPGFSEIGGFWASTILIVVGSTGLYWAYKKNDWL
jgi:magnesium transporter